MFSIKWDEEYDFLKYQWQPVRMQVILVESNMDLEQLIEFITISFGSKSHIINIYHELMWIVINKQPVMIWLVKHIIFFYCSMLVCIAHLHVQLCNVDMERIFAHYEASWWNEFSVELFDSF